MNRRSGHSVVGLEQLLGGCLVEERACTGKIPKIFSSEDRKPPYTLDFWTASCFWFGGLVPCSSWIRMRDACLQLNILLWRFSSSQFRHFRYNIVVPVSPLIIEKKTSIQITFIFWILRHYYVLCMVSMHKYDTYGVLYQQSVLWWRLHAASSKPHLMYDWLDL